MIGLGITYSVTGGSSLHNFYTMVCTKNAMGECHSAGLSVWIIVFSAIHLFLIQVRTSSSAIMPVCSACSKLSHACLIRNTAMPALRCCCSGEVQQESFSGLSAGSLTYILIMKLVHTSTTLHVSMLHVRVLYSSSHVLVLTSWVYGVYGEYPCPHCFLCYQGLQSVPVVHPLP